MSAPFSPHQNGTAERAWRTTFDMARCLILQSGVPKTLWHYADSAASFTRNRCYNKRLNLTPFEVVTHKKPNLKDMQPFGKPCYGYVQKPKKLEDRAEKGIFIGMDRDSPAHLVYFPESDKVKKIRVVKFFQENSVQIQNEQNETVIIHESASDEEDFVSPKEKQGVPQSPETETGETNKRVRAKPKYLEDYVANVELDERVNVALHYCYGMNVPKTFDDAMNCEDSEMWKKAMDVEMSALRENDTYELTTLPPGKDIVGGKWAFAVKDNQNDAPTFKARFIAKGYSQTQDIDYEETFSPTAHMSSLRALMQISVQNNMIINQMDMKSAYLNAPIDYEIYVKQPEGYENCEKLVLRLNKSLYGLKQSGRNWNQTFHKFMSEQGFQQSQNDTCVYTKSKGDDLIIILVWVDDVIIASNNKTLLERTKDGLKSQFKMKDLGVISHFLGIEFHVQDGSITMTHSKYIAKILEHFGMQEFKPRKTPAEIDVKPSVSEKLDDHDSSLYKSIVEHNRGDIFTKPLCSMKINKFVNMIMGK
ncbi:hypothetical protein EGW08_020887 [Elysia chlorotica]|uniref:Uncharacterized protein n=1 Tax=Elysia chlorotica TaxID=188477 RepID=A0A3S0Z5V5_ELYCH|nr:hypothetical protein EGW08_020887 [Elysia chlorotica]